MKVLVAVDLSTSTQKVITAVELIAKAMSAKVLLLHVAEPDPDFVGWEAGPNTVRDSQTEVFHKQHRHLQEIANNLRLKGVDTTALLIQGATADVILEKASKIKANMIVVGSHGRGMAYQVIVGSVSEVVVRKSECPVLVVPTHNTS